MRLMIICFNPLPAFRPGETRQSQMLPYAGGQVSIHSRLFGREKRRQKPHSAAGAGVSIHSRLFGREKPSNSTTMDSSLAFQSTPGFSAGRNRSSFRRRQGLPCFNPLPAFRPGETHDRRADPAGRDVSIHSRLFGREKQGIAVAARQALQVSIHSRLFGREKPAERGPSSIADAVFQSTPGFSAGRNARRRNHAGGPAEVSIHSRLFGREKRRRRRRRRCAHRVSIHSRLFGREKRSRPDWRWRRRGCFNPLPAFRPGETCAPRAKAKPMKSFNPLPAFRPGETAGIHGLVASVLIVSIHSRLFGREKRAFLVYRYWDEMFQSTPGFSAGRNASKPSRLKVL